MPENFISLKCQSCGGKLDVYPDMERFACGYCGTEMLVHRRGGTVALKLVQEAIKKVQVGTDKTAAELALMRLNDDVNALRAKASSLIEADSGKGMGLGCASIFFFIGIMALFSSTEDEVLVALWFIVPGLIVYAWASRSNKNTVKEIEARITHVNRKIAEQKEIVDS